MVSPRRRRRPLGAVGDGPAEVAGPLGPGQGIFQGREAFFQIGVLAQARTQIENIAGRGPADVGWRGSILQQADQGMDAFLGGPGENIRGPLQRFILDGVDARLEVRLLAAAIDGAFADAGLAGGLGDGGALGQERYKERVGLRFFLGSHGYLVLQFR